MFWWFECRVLIMHENHWRFFKSQQTKTARTDYTNFEFLFCFIYPAIHGFRNCLYRCLIIQNSKLYIVPRPPVSRIECALAFWLNIGRGGDRGTDAKKKIATDGFCLVEPKTDTIPCGERQIEKVLSQHGKEGLLWSKTQNWCHSYSVCHLCQCFSTCFWGTARQSAFLLPANSQPDSPHGPRWETVNHATHSWLDPTLVLQTFQFRGP